MRDEAGRSGAGYRPLDDYAAIGDCHGAALVSRTGSIDWCCLERFDADPVFCRILDRTRGGHLSIAPVGRHTVDRANRDRTNILVTTFVQGAARLKVTDFMAVGRRPGATTHDYTSLAAPGWLVRLVEVHGGPMRVRVAYRPSRDFAAVPVVLREEEGGIAADGGPFLHHDLPCLAVAGGEACGEWELAQGSRHVMVLAPRRAAVADIAGAAHRCQEITEAFWVEWIRYCRYTGPYQSAVIRSALALKLLTYAPTGALVAAPTTSLPEEIGGERNWDYRYCWLRDATMTLYALSVIGYGGEARRFGDFLSVACPADDGGVLHIMYDIRGDMAPPEAELGHLEGYCGSRPVRVGNAARDQLQNDIYGEVLDWALLQRAMGGRLDRRMRQLGRTLADHVAACWQVPDQGLWETRTAPRHHVHGKLMCWVALDRALDLFGHDERWAHERARLLDSLLAEGIDPATGGLRQAYGGASIDASTLLVPMLGVPLGDAVVAATVAAVEARLRDGDLVWRYDGEDGVRGSEGAFLICSFWLVDALLWLDRPEEAEALFRRLVARANDVGIYAEEMEAGSGRFLGNLPQAFTHLALIGSATHLWLYREHGRPGLQGSHADRARRLVGATMGWRGTWQAILATRRVGRLRSSRRSIMPRDIA